MNINTLTNNNRNIPTLKLFRTLVYSWILFYYNTLGLKAEFFYGPDSPIPYRKSIDLFGSSFFNLFQIDLIKNYPVILIALLNIFVIASFFKMRNRVFPLLILYVVYTLDNRAYPIIDAGNNIINILLVYNVFFDLKKREKNENVFSTTLSNLFVLMSKIQICLVYFVAGYQKLQGVYWTNGTALYYTMSLDTYSYPMIKEYMKTLNPHALIMTTYGVVLFQLLFPWLVWFRKTKKIILSIGLIFHLFIGLVMGLNYFALAFCISYSIFYNEEEVRIFRERSKKKSPSE